MCGPLFKGSWPRALLFQTHAHQHTRALTNTYSWVPSFSPGTATGLLHLTHSVPIPRTQAYSSLRTTHVGMRFQLVPGAKRGGGEGHRRERGKLGVTGLGLGVLGYLQLERERSEESS